MWSRTTFRRRGDVATSPSLEPSSPVHLAAAIEHEIGPAANPVDGEAVADVNENTMSLEDRPSEIDILQLSGLRRASSVNPPRLWSGSEGLGAIPLNH